MKAIVGFLLLLALIGICQASPTWGGWGGSSGWNTGGYRTVKVVRVVPKYSSGWYSSSPWNSGWSSGWKSGWW